MISVDGEGHADERGTRAYNLAPGERRANSANNYLVSRAVEPNRISTISYGKQRPAAMGSDEAALSLARSRPDRRRPPCRRGLRL